MELIADIIVPTYNRQKELDRFFNENASLEHLPVHIWIIDDCSSPPVKEHLPSWKNLTLIRLEENQGQAAARNAAIIRGIAPMVISLDDDAWFEDAGSALQEMSKLFGTWPKVGCIMFNVATPTSDFQRLPTGTKLSLHVTCGCVYRREMLLLIGGFSGFLHSQAEETDLSIRIYCNEFEIIFAERIKVFHNFLPADRPTSWYLKARHNTTRNDLLIVWMYFPLVVLLPALGIKMLSHLKFAIVSRVSVLKTIGSTLMAGLDFVRLIPKASAHRQAFTLKQWWNWYQLQRNNLISKTKSKVI